MSNLRDSKGELRVHLKECNPPYVLYSEVFPSQCQSHDQNNLCNETIEQVRIGQDCFPYLKLCSNMDPDHPSYTHSDHITFCQNYTFWNSKYRIDEEGFHVRPWTDETGGKIYACRGNFPGFNSHPFYDKKQVKPGCHKGHCPDVSDIVCNHADCLHGSYIQCKDKSYCIPDVLVCDGYVNCMLPDKEGIDEDSQFCTANRNYSSHNG